MEQSKDGHDIVPKKSFFESLKEKFFSFDLYAQPLNLTYDTKTSFKTTYGLIFSLLTFAICAFLIIDNVVFFQPKNMCYYSQMDDNVISTYNLDTVNEFFMFYAIFDKGANKYMNPLEKKEWFTVALKVNSKSITSDGQVSFFQKTDTE